MLVFHLEAGLVADHIVVVVEGIVGLEEEGTIVDIEAGGVACQYSAVLPDSTNLQHRPAGAPRKT